jgi:hypothetical protein
MQRLQPKEISQGDDTLNPNFEETSIFHDMSEIKRKHTSGLSHQALLEARSSIHSMVAYTEKVSDLIEDGNTTLVFKETVIEASGQEIVNQRYLVYQRAVSEGQIKIKSKAKTGLEIEIEDEPVVFRQCTFFLCDTRESTENPGTYLSVGIKIACEQKVSFIDCAFIGITFTTSGTKTTGVDFMVFTDCFSKITLELTNCYFTGVRSILSTNFPVRSLSVTQCTFDGMESDCIHVTHPAKLLLAANQFVDCANLPISVKLFDQDNNEKQAKRASVFGNSTKIDNSVVRRSHPASHRGVRRWTQKTSNQVKPRCSRRKEEDTDQRQRIFWLRVVHQDQRHEEKRMYLGRHGYPRRRKHLRVYKEHLPGLRVCVRRSARYKPQ